MRYSVVAFDWDGTLADSTDCIAAGLQYAHAKMGLGELSVEKAKSVIGLSFADMIPRIAPSLPSEKLQTYIDCYVESYLEADKTIALYDGIAELIATLKKAGIRVTLVTGKSRKGVNRITNRMGILPWFDATYCADEYRSKPDPMMLNVLMREFNVPAERVVMVGDALFDIGIAKNAGVDSIAVTWGASQESVLQEAQPTQIARSIPELTEMLLAD